MISEKHEREDVQRRKEEKGEGGGGLEENQYISCKKSAMSNCLNARFFFLSLSSFPSHCPLFSFSPPFSFSGARKQTPLFLSACSYTCFSSLEFFMLNGAGFTSLLSLLFEIIRIISII